MPADPQQTAATSQGGVTVPPELEKKYPELLTLIRGSESMNDEERQYWINILPIMTPEQVANLRGILENEKRQLAEIDKKYAKEIQSIDAQKQLQNTEEERRKRRDDLHQEETAFSKQEAEKEEDLLEQIENL